MTLQEIREIFSLVRESDVEDLRRANPYFRVLPKPDIGFFPGFVLAYDPEMIEDLYPEDLVVTPRVADQLERLYLANPESFTTSVFKMSSAEVYNTVRNGFGTDAEIVSFFGDDLDVPMKDTATSVEKNPPMETSAAPEEEKAPVEVKEPMIPREIPTAIQSIDYGVLRGVMRDLLEEYLFPQRDAQQQILAELKERNAQKDTEDMQEFVSSFGELIKSVNQISGYINSADLKASEDRQSVRALMRNVQDAVSNQIEAFAVVGQATAILNDQSKIYEEVINRYSGVELFTSDDEFFKMLSNLDRLNSPSAFIYAFKEALKALWYSGDRQTVERILVTTVSILKEGV